jgi:hypothetical protein
MASRVIKSAVEDFLFWLIGAIMLAGSFGWIMDGHSHSALEWFGIAAAAIVGAIIIVPRNLLISIRMRLPW